MERKEREQEKYPLKIQGSFGKFKTSKSYEVDYLLCSIPAIKIFDDGYLKTFSEAFSFEDIDFEEMLQRDIDPSRVSDIKNKYLLDNTKKKALFFPPLIVAIVGVDGKSPVTSFKPKKSFVEASEEIHIDFDEDRFRVVLFSSKEDKSRSINTDDNIKRFYLHYSVELQINPQKVSMVVLDGQHRFEAMKSIYKDEKVKGELNELEIPLCIVYPPIYEEGTSEDVIKDYRELFIRINKTPQKVSGHFIELLNDNSLSAITIQKLAEKWKFDPIKQNETLAEYSKLQFLEWNQRDDKKADQRTKAHSITTVNVLVAAIRKYALLVERNKNKSKPALILGLEAIKTELESKDDSIRVNSISDETFDPEQLEIIKPLLQTVFVDSLNCLFTEAKPYKELIEKYKGALNKIIELSKQDDVSKAYLEKYIRNFKEPDKLKSKKENETILGPEMRAAKNNFDQWLEIDESEDVYFYNVFQKGLIKLWLDLSENILSTRNISLKPKDVSVALIEALNEWAFLSKKGIFSKEAMYVKGVLFDGQRVVVGETAIDAWEALLAFSLLNERSFNKFIEVAVAIIGKKEGGLLEAKIKEYCESKLEEYLESFVSAFSKRIKMGEILIEDDIDEKNTIALNEIMTKLSSEKDQDLRDKLEGEKEAIILKLAEIKRKDAKKKIKAKCNV